MWKLNSVLMNENDKSKNNIKKFLEAKEHDNKI